MFDITVLQIFARQALLMASKEMGITGPHAAKQTYVWLYYHGWKVIDHPPFSPLLNFASVHKHLSLTLYWLGKQLVHVFT